MKLGLGVSAIVAACATMQSMATDLGLPVVNGDAGRRIGVEIVGQRYKRDIEVDYGWGKGPERLKEDRAVGRVLLPLGERCAANLDAGVVDPKHGGDLSPVFGGSLRALVYGGDNLGLNVFLSGFYVHDIKTRRDDIVAYAEARPQSGADGDLAIPWPNPVSSVRSTESYYELSGGALLSRVFHVDPKSAMIPYGGFMVSRLDGRRVEEWSYDDESRHRERANWREESLLALVLGCGVTLDNRLSLRVEGRFVSQSIISAGLLYSF